MSFEGSMHDEMLRRSNAAHKAAERELGAKMDEMRTMVTRMASQITEIEVAYEEWKREGEVGPLAARLEAVFGR